MLVVYYTKKKTH